MNAYIILLFALVNTYPSLFGMRRVTGRLPKPITVPTVTAATTPSTIAQLPTTPPPSYQQVPPPVAHVPEYRAPMQQGWIMPVERIVERLAPYIQQEEERLEMLHWLQNHPEEYTEAFEEPERFTQRMRKQKQTFHETRAVLSQTAPMTHAMRALFYQGQQRAAAAAAAESSSLLVPTASEALQITRGSNVSRDISYDPDLLRQLFQQQSAQVAQPTTPVATAAAATSTPPQPAPPKRIPSKAPPKPVRKTAAQVHQEKALTLTQEYEATLAQELMNHEAMLNTLRTYYVEIAVKQQELYDACIETKTKLAQQNMETLQLFTQEMHTRNTIVEQYLKELETIRTGEQKALQEIRQKLQLIEEALSEQQSMQKHEMAERLGLLQQHILQHAMLMEKIQTYQSIEKNIEKQRSLVQAFLSLFSEELQARKALEETFHAEQSSIKSELLQQGTMITQKENIAREQALRLKKERDARTRAAYQKKRAQEDAAKEERLRKQQTDEAKRLQQLEQKRITQEAQREAERFAQMLEKERAAELKRQALEQKQLQKEFEKTLHELQATERVTRALYEQYAQIALEQKQLYDECLDLMQKTTDQEATFTDLKTTLFLQEAHNRQAIIDEAFSSLHQLQKNQAEMYQELIIKKAAYQARMGAIAAEEKEIKRLFNEYTRSLNAIAQAEQRAKEQRLFVQKALHMFEDESLSRNDITHQETEEHLALQKASHLIQQKAFMEQLEQQQKLLLAEEASARSILLYYTDLLRQQAEQDRLLKNLQQKMAANQKQKDIDQQQAFIIEELMARNQLQHNAITDLTKIIHHEQEEIAIIQHALERTQRDIKAQADLETIAQDTLTQFAQVLLHQAKELHNTFESIQKNIIQQQKKEAETSVLEAEMRDFLNILLDEEVISATKPTMISTGTTTSSPGSSSHIVQTDAPIVLPTPTSSIDTQIDPHVIPQATQPQGAATYPPHKPANTLEQPQQDVIKRDVEYTHDYSTNTSSFTKKPSHTSLEWSMPTLNFQNERYRMPSRRQKSKKSSTYYNQSKIPTANNDQHEHQEQYHLDPFDADIYPIESHNSSDTNKHALYEQSYNTDDIEFDEPNTEQDSEINPIYQPEPIGQLIIENKNSIKPSSTGKKNTPSQEKKGEKNEGDALPENSLWERLLEWLKKLIEYIKIGLSRMNIIKY